MTRPSTLRQIAIGSRMYLLQSQRDLGIILAFVVLFPIGFLFFLGVIAAPGALPQIVVGSVMMEMALLNINVLAQNIGSDRQNKLYDLWVSLPMSPVVYAVVNAVTLLPFSLLSGVLMIGIGAAAFHLALLPVLPELLAALLLVWASTLGIGFLVAVYGGPPRRVNTLSQFVGIVMTFFAPVFYPPSVLPVAAQYVAYAWPLTWGALLLRGIMGSDWGSALLAAGVLGAFTVGGTVLIAGGLRWREP